MLGFLNLYFDETKWKKVLASCVSGIPFVNLSPKTSFDPRKGMVWINSSDFNAHGMRRWILWRKMYHAWLFDFLGGLGVGNDPLNFQNRAIGGFWENARFIRSNGRKTIFEWPKVVSEVIFPRFWGVVCIKKCFRNFEIVIGSAGENSPQKPLSATQRWFFGHCYV